MNLQSVLNQCDAKDREVDQAMSHLQSECDTLSGSMNAHVHHLMLKDTRTPDEDDALLSTLTRRAALQIAREQVGANINRSQESNPPPVQPMP